MIIKHTFKKLTCCDKEFPVFTELPKSPTRCLRKDSTDEFLHENYCKIPIKFHKYIRAMVGTSDKGVYREAIFLIDAEYVDLATEIVKDTNGSNSWKLNAKNWRYESPPLPIYSETDPYWYITQYSEYIDTEDKIVKAEIVESIMNKLVTSKLEGKTNFNTWCDENLPEPATLLLFLLILTTLCFIFQAASFITFYAVVLFSIIFITKIVSLLSSISADNLLNNVSTKLQHNNKETSQVSLENQAVKNEYHEIVKLRNKHKSLLESIKEDNVALTYENAWFMQSLPQKLDVIQECYSKTTALRYSAKMLVGIDVTLKQLTDTLDKIEMLYQNELASRISVELVAIQRMQSLNESVLDGN